MKRFAVSLIASFLAFTAGLVTASSWNATTRHRSGIEPTVVYAPAAPCPPPQAQSSTQIHTYTPPSPTEYSFAQGRMKLVPLSYNINVNYPQLVGPDDPAVRKVNQHLKEFAARLHQRSANPVKARIYDDVHSTFQVNMATETYLSLSFIYYPYTDDSQNPTSQTFTLNYDLTSGKPMKLSELFKGGSNYLQFISRYTIDDLTRYNLSLIPQALSPSAANFLNWQITPNGITFEFAACKVRSCDEGEQIVSIPFTELKPLLRPDIPGKFQITYP